MARGWQREWRGFDRCILLLWRCAHGCRSSRRGIHVLSTIHHPLLTRTLSSSSETHSHASSSQVLVSLHSKYSVLGLARAAKQAKPGGFWLTYGATLQPFYGASATYAIANNKPAAEGGMEPGFLVAFGELLLPAYDLSLLDSKS